MTTCCLSSLISSDHVSHVSNYAAGRADELPTKFLFEAAAATCSHVRVLSAGCTSLRDGNERGEGES